MLSATHRRVRSRVDPRASAAARQGITTIADQAVVSVTNFVTGVIIARTCSRAELGLYSLGFGLVLLVTSAQTFVVSTPYNVYCLRVPDGERAAYTGSTLVHQLAIAAVSALGLAAAAGVLSGRATVPGLPPLLATLAATISLALLREYGRQLFFSRLRFSSALLLDATVSVVQLGALLAVAATGRLSARAAFAISGASAAVAVAIWAAMARDLFEFKASRVLPAFRRNWTTGRWSLAAGIAGVAGAQLYPWLIATGHGTDEVGILAACTGITAVTNPLVIGMSNFLAPQITHAFAAGGIDGVRRVTRVALLVFGALMAVLTPALFVGGSELLRVVYGPRYAGHGLTVGVLALALVADWLSLPAHYALLFMERADVTFKSNLVQVAVAVTLGFALVAAYGALGAALGLLVGYALASAFKWKEYRKRLVTWPADVALAAAGSAS